MSKVQRWPYILAFLITTIGSALCGCNDQSGASTIDASAEVDPHAGHNHGPGEHADHEHADHEHAEPVGAVSELDWCAEHRVPESECTQCHPELVDSFKANGDWCSGHEMPESHCRLCNQGIEFPQETALESTELELIEDEIEVSLHFRPNSAACATDGALIQFASAETAERAGITTERAVASHMEDVIKAPAEVVFDETRQTVVTTTVASLVARWMVAPGEYVEEGTPLAILQSPDIARLQAEFLSAHAALGVQEQELARHDELRKKNLISLADYDHQAAVAAQLRAEYKSSRGLLTSAGMNTSDISSLLDGGQIDSRFTLYAPADGLMVERRAQLGQLLDAGSALVILADPSSMWIEARVTEEQLKYIRPGQLLTFTSDGTGKDRVGARIIWVSRFLDMHTRTGTVRAEVLDPAHGLQAGEFGRVSISMPEETEVCLVPKSSVQWEGCCNVVFVRESANTFRPRKIRFGEGRGPYYQVTDGVNAGEDIVVGGSYLLKTELKKTSLGAGCCGLEPAG
jgi:cobalt-zinc-cadmium efflux system membrane fusion protein